MSTDKARRGRPKGSGLDDRMTLEAMRELIAKDPSLKPTTAIRMLGITDPSAIRRLRDKYKFEAPDLDATGAEPSSVLHRESLDLVAARPKSFIAPHATEDRIPASDTALLERVRPDVPQAQPLTARQLRIVSSSSAPDATTASSEPRVVSSPAPQVSAPQPSEKEAASSAKSADQTPSQTSKTSKPQSHGDVAATLLVRWYALGMTAALSTAEAQVRVMESVLKVPPVALAVRQQLMFCELAKAFLPGGGKKPKRRS